MIIYIAQSIEGSPNTTPYQRGSFAVRQYETHFITRRGVDPTIEEEAAEVRESGESILMRILFPIWAVLQAKHIARQSHDDIKFVYTDFTPQALVAGFILSTIGYEWIADIFDSPHFSVSLEETRKSLGRYLAQLYNESLLLLLQRVLRRADLIIVAMHPDILAPYGVHETDENVYVTTNGTERDAFEEIEYIPRNTPADPDSEKSVDFRIVYIGPVKRVRGLQTFLDGLQMAEDDGSLQGATVQLVGSVDTADTTWLEDMRRDFDSITMETPGRVEHEEALRYIRDADVCVCPLSSTVENYVHAYPIKVFEYMAGGCAIIATELKGTSRIINDGETGLLIPSETSRAWADALKTLYRDDDFRRRLGESALKSVEEYEWARINKQIGERIEEDII